MSSPNSLPHPQSQSPPLPNLHNLSISPYPRHTDYPYNGVFGPPQSTGWENKRGSRGALPASWYEPHSRESPNGFDTYRRDASPPALSPPSSTTSAPTTSSNPYQTYHPQYVDQSFVPLGVTPSPPPQMGYMNTSGSAPNLAAFQVQSGMPQFGSQSLAGINRQWRGFGPSPNMAMALEDDVIPTAIVIKNIPFAVPRETLLGVIESLGAPLPYAFNYHHDNGVFRGLAFANFRAQEEAAAVVAALNGYDLQGRKLRVEYKKVLQPGEKDKIEREKALKRMRSIQFEKEPPAPVPPIHVPANIPNGGDHSPPHSATSATSDSFPVTLDMNDPTTLDMYSRLLLFKEDRMRDEMAFSRTLSPIERRIVHLTAQKLGLSSMTKGEGESRYVVVYRDAPSRPTLTTSSSAATMPMSSTYLSPYSSTPADLSPSLRIKKSMPDLRGFSGPVVARDPARSLTPQRSSGNLRDSREYVSMGAAQGRRANGSGLGSGTFNSFFGSPVDIPPVPPLPSGLGLKQTISNGTSNSNSNPNGTSPVDSSFNLNGSANGNGVGVGVGTVNGNGDVVQPQPVRNPRGPTGESRGFLRPSASGILRGSISLGTRLSEEEEEGVESTRTRESLDL